MELCITINYFELSHTLFYNHKTQLIVKKKLCRISPKDSRPLHGSCTAKRCLERS